MNIGLVGRRRAGKDTVANYLVERHGYTRVAFADPLKEAALKLDPIIGYSPRRLTDAVKLWGWDGAKDRVPEVRRLLQVLGVECGREIHGQDTWVRQALTRIRSVDGPVAVSDVRFPNEVQALRDEGFLIVKLVREGIEHTAADSHPSELYADVLEADVVLWNDRGIDDLTSAVEREVLTRGESE